MFSAQANTFELVSDEVDSSEVYGEVLLEVRDSRVRLMVDETYVLSVCEGASGSLVDCQLTLGESRTVRVSRDNPGPSSEKLGRERVKSVRRSPCSVLLSDVQAVLELTDSVL